MNYSYSEMNGGLSFCYGAVLSALGLIEVATLVRTYTINTFSALPRLRFLRILPAHNAFMKVAQPWNKSFLKNTSIAWIYNIIYYIFFLQTLYNVTSITSENRTIGPGVLAYVPVFPHFIFVTELHPHYPRIKTLLAKADGEPDSLKDIDMFLINSRGPLGTKRLFYLYFINSYSRSDADKSLILSYSFTDTEIRITFYSATDYLDVIKILSSEGKDCTDDLF